MYVRIYFSFFFIRFRWFLIIFIYMYIKLGSGQLLLFDDIWDNFIPMPLLNWIQYSWFICKSSINIKKKKKKYGKNAKKSEQRSPVLPIPLSAASTISACASSFTHTHTHPRPITIIPCMLYAVVEFYSLTWEYAQVIRRIFLSINPFANWRN